MLHEAHFTQQQLQQILPPSAPKLPVYVIAIPSQLARFLQAVTLPDMHAAVIYMLADAAQGEDTKGLAQMHRDLPPSVWSDLVDLMERTVAQRMAGWGVADGASPEITRASFLLDAALQTASKHDYWKVQVEVGFVQPIMLGGLHLNSMESDGQEIAEFCWTYVMKRHAEAQAEAGIDLIPRTALILRSLYQDWCRYVEICASKWRRSEACKVALELLNRLVETDRQRPLWEKINVIRDSAENAGSFISWLPPQIVEHVILPNVVVDEGNEAVAEKKRKIAERRRRRKSA